MKTSNLLLILGIGGIGYYFLKNKKSNTIASSSAPSTTYTPPTNIQNQLVENPYATATKVDNSFYNTPVSTPNVNTIDTVNTAPTSTIKPTTNTTATATSTLTSSPSVKIETALSTLDLYLKKLPELSLSNAGSQKVFDLYPIDGVWKIAPDQINSPLWDRMGLEEAMKYNPTNYSSIGTQFLVLNPTVRNKFTVYVDQFGNIIDAGRGVNGMAVVSARSIAEYRIKNNIPF